MCYIQKHPKEKIRIVIYLLVSTYAQSAFTVGLQTDGIFFTNMA